MSIDEDDERRRRGRRCDVRHSCADFGRSEETPPFPALPLLLNSYRRRRAHHNPPRPVMPETKKAADATACSLSDLNEKTLEHVASFLPPPSVFNLLLASKESFWGAPAPATGPSPSSRASLALTPFARRLIQSALKRHLEGVVRAVTTRHSPHDDERPAFELDDVFPDVEDFDFLEDSATPQVLISGSLAVQAALGKDGEERDWSRADVDIFCTAKAAPFVRKRLFERCGLICTGLMNSYGASLDRDVADPLVGMMMRSKRSVRLLLSHVESYAPRPTKGDTSEPMLYIPPWDSDENALKYDSDEYYEQVKKWGAETVEEAEYKLQEENLDFSPLGFPPGDTFLYDYNLDNYSFVQLIIGLPGRVADARDLLREFDLEICKCSYDGRTFRVPAPVQTFASRSTVDPARRYLVDDFMRKRAKHAPNVDEISCLDSDPAMEKAIAKMTKKGWKGIGMHPYVERERVDFDIADREFLDRYEFLAKIVARLRKYARRGVEIIDPPHDVVDSDVVVPEVMYR